MIWFGRNVHSVQVKRLDKWHTLGPPNIFSRMHGVSSDKKRGLFQHFPGCAQKIFKNLFVAHECLNISYWQHKIKSRGLELICEQSNQKKWLSVEPTKKMRDFQGYLSRTLQDLKLNPVEWNGQLGVLRYCEWIYG